MTIYSNSVAMLQKAFTLQRAFTLFTFDFDYKVLADIGRVKHESFHDEEQYRRITKIATFTNEKVMWYLHSASN